MNDKRTPTKAKKSASRKAAMRKPSRVPASTADFAKLVERVVTIIEEARSRVLRTVNSEMVLSYWHIGREIVEYVQRGETRAEYGEQVIDDLSEQLQARVGRGYSTTNLKYFRLFYLQYRERQPSIRAQEFRTRLVRNSGENDGTEFVTGLVTNSKRGKPVKIRHEPSDEL